MTHPVLCAGRLYCDLVFADAPRLPTLGTEVFAPSLSLHAGGGAFITGATLAGLGHPAAQLSNIPAAPFDSTVLAEMAKYGIDPTFCTAARDGIDPQITVAIGTNGDRAFLTRDAGAALPDFEGLDFSNFAHLHISELGTLQAAPELLERAKDAGITVSLDCGWQDTFDPAVVDLISQIDVFLPNESEAAALAAIGVPDDCAKLTVVKCGPDGARALAKGTINWISRPIETTVEVRDATGAGDSFNAGFLSGWLHKEPLETCLAKGNSCGAATVQVVGGIGVPAYSG